MRPWIKLSDRSGFSLVELIVSLMILALVYTITLKVFTGQTTMQAESELTSKAIFLARMTWTEVTAKRFDENRTAPWTSTGSFGLDANDGGSYDDLDDYYGYVNSSIPGYPGFTARVRVFYVNPSGNLDDSVGTVTDGKKIMVTVSHQGIDPVMLESLVTSHY